MNEPLGTYTFLPWVRQGVANNLAAPAAGARATIAVTVNAEGTETGGGTRTEAVSRAIELYGPGDIVGIDNAQISRTEPCDWVTNFEPNFLAAIEFYDEDFPWRYTPAPPSGRRLLPWITLVVLEEDGEFEEGTGIAGRPLSYIKTLKPFAEILPVASDGWAWAHGHFNAAFSGNVMETDAALASSKARDVISSAPDTACSRLLCPRKLKPRTGYHAFLVPSFESGRLAGLGIDPGPLFADAANLLTPLSSAWSDYPVPANRPESSSLPFYHRWYFRTADDGDFEKLVRLLRPKPADPRVGRRPMDVSDPSPSIGGIAGLSPAGVLQLGGALRAPATRDAEWVDPADYPHPFQEQLAAFLNLSDSYQAQGPSANSDSALGNTVRSDPDPLITPPIYGRWHALSERLLTGRDGTAIANRRNWLHDINLDPRYRTAAGFGTEVVQRHQEKYMEGAWDQVGDILEANRRIRLGQFAKYAGISLHRRNFVAHAANGAPGLLLLHAPVAARVISGGLTVSYQLQRSPLGVSLTSTAMRRAARPGGKLAKRLAPGGTSVLPMLVERVNSGEIAVSPPKDTPQAILTPGDLAAAASGALVTDHPGLMLHDFYERHPLLFGLLLLLLCALLLIFGSVLILTGAVALGALFAWSLTRHARPLLASRASAARLAEDAILPGTVDAIPPAPAFTLEPSPALEAPPASRPPATQGPDSADARSFKQSLKDQYRLIDMTRRTGRAEPERAIDLDRIAGNIINELDPVKTVPDWIFSGVNIPPRITEQIGERFVEAMAYPEFDTPMYEPLAKPDADKFVPNIHLVEPDSVTLLETNQAFIESYMVGLNHEFARELLWREYPTDQRGSYFRQFWDVRRKLAQATDRDAAREALKDIRPLHLWPGASNLEEHDNREAGAVAEDEVVLVIRGELLKKYPNTVVSAQPARWKPGADGRPDKSQERELDDSKPAITPLYEARIEPDVFFFGFDLTASEARGDDDVDDRPGWFFRIEEVPGDARFGFDSNRDAATAINVWNDLSWPDFAPGLADGGHVKIADIPARTLAEPSLTGPDGEKREQWEHDRNVPVNSEISAAEIAYISLQVPVLMAVHAAELLGKEGA